MSRASVSFARVSLPALGVLVLGLLTLFGPGAGAQEACPAPAPVCAARAAVFAVEGLDNGSAVRLGPQRLVTSRHLVAELEEIRLHLPDGRRVAAEVIPSSYEGDVLLLQAAGLPPGPSLEPEVAAPWPNARLFTAPSILCFSASSSGPKRIWWSTARTTPPDDPIFPSPSSRSSR